jgi:hypothetical protein
MWSTTFRRNLLTPSSHSLAYLTYFGNIVFKHSVALMYLFVYIYEVFPSQMQLITLSHFSATTCFGRTRPSSGARLSCNINRTAGSSVFYVVRAEAESDLSPQSSAKVKNGGAIPTLLRAS